jgi:TonB family protein
MISSFRLLFIWTLLCAGLCAEPGDSTLSLFCEWDGQRLPVSAVTEDGKIQAIRDGKTVDVPKKARWLLEGDIRHNAALLNWSPRYTLKRRREPDQMKDAGHPYEASVTTHFAPSSNQMTEWAGAGLRQHWPATTGKREAIVVVWVVGGNVTQVGVDGLDPAKGVAKTDFVLTSEEAAGQPIMLLWSVGRFVAPVPAFADGIDATALMAAMLDDWRSLEPLVRANPQLGSAATTANIPLLHMAAEAGALTVVEGLVAADAKARPKIKDLKTSATEWAAEKGRTRMVELLLAKGFDKNAADKDSRTALLRACSAGHSEVVALLLKAGANPDIESLQNHRPISEAIDHGYLDIVELLEPKVRAKFSDSRENRGVLRTQAQKGHAGMVRWLLKKGISPNASGDGPSPLGVAALGGHEAVVTALLESKASVKWIDAASGNTALMYAASRGHAACVRRLLSAGADATAKNNRGATALHLAAVSDAAECVEILLAAGADWAVKNDLKLSALDLALYGQNQNAVEVIAAHGGRIAVKPADTTNVIESILRVDSAAVLQRAIEDGWAPSSKLQGWPALVAARQFGAQACVAVLQAAGARDDEPLPENILRAQDVEVKPRLVKALIPRDPREADEEFEAQTVIVDALIDSKGSLRFARVLNSPDKRLALAVLDCLPRWEFIPAKRGEQPVAVRLRFPVGLPSSEKRIFALTAVDEMPKPISQKRPVYPFSSRKAGQEARVLVRYVVNAEGNVEDVDVRERSSRECTDAAVAAVRTWKYTPAKRQGKPVAVEMVLPIIFNLVD